MDGLYECSCIGVHFGLLIEADKGRCPCNQLLLNDPSLDDHPIMKSITVPTALQMETRSEYDDKPTKGRAG